MAAGSPHTWPTLLAALTWLIELLSCEEAGDDDDDAGLLQMAQQQKQEDAGASAVAGADATKSLEEEVEVRSEKAFFRFLGDSYVAFLAGDDAKYAALEEHLCEYFEGDNVKIEQDFAALTEKNRTISEDIQNLLQNGEQ